MDRVRRAARYLWASPNTLLGLLLGGVAWAGGGRVEVVAGVVEVSGAGVRRVFRILEPFGFAIGAMTLGHVVLARNRRLMARWRAHEAIHVRQCERWGPAFLPAYLVATLVAALRGEDPYRENRFEREAYARAPDADPEADAMV